MDDIEQIMDLIIGIAIIICSMGVLSIAAKCIMWWATRKDSEPPY